MENAPLPAESKRAIQRPKHSQSCVDISRGRKAFEDDEDDVDTMPLLDADGQLKKSTSMEKNLTVNEKGGGTSKKSATRSQRKNEKGNMGQQHNHTKAAANIRKTKSMEVLSRQTDHTGVGDLDEKGLEKRKQEAHKNFVKEKMKFSAFLNEITRQNQKTAIIMLIQNLITIMPVQNHITIMPIQNLITIMPIQNRITIMPIENPNAIMPIQNCITIMPIQNHIIIILIQNLITIMSIQNLITIMSIQNLITIMPIQNLITIMPIKKLITII
ncbi:LIM domain-containing A-like protein [Labeo rohita]|uniref:LIM domain-containing A-like protein n=1 Tax=Labeo rohita TaxID=84645 RepID=A0A498LIX3_LABRO|nr:LIM domain-containing A-like protein [Labeo rohita]